MSEKMRKYEATYDIWTGGRKICDMSKVILIPEYLPLELADATVQGLAQTPPDEFLKRFTDPMQDRWTLNTIYEHFVDEKGEKIKESRLVFSANGVPTAAPASGPTTLVYP